MHPVALPYLTVAHVRGADAPAFLHAQLSADVAALKDGGATFACFCSPRGQAYGLLLVCRCGDDFLLAANAKLLPRMLQRLQLFVLRARVEFEMADNLTVYGSMRKSMDVKGGRDFEPAGMGLHYSIQKLFDDPGAEVSRWKAEELSHGVVWLGPETSERYIPQMLGLEGIGAVSFSKGCYPGQEIIARARYLGKVKRKPLCLKLESGPEMSPGQALRLLDGEHWLDGTLIDSAAPGPAPNVNGLVAFVVAPVPENAVETMEYEGVRYRCATM